MTSYFVIVSREDHVIYEADLSSGTKVRARLVFGANPRPPKPLLVYP
jgi:hypothetical protein